MVQHSHTFFIFSLLLFLLLLHFRFLQCLIGINDVNKIIENKNKIQNQKGRIGIWFLFLKQKSIKRAKLFFLEIYGKIENEKIKNYITIQHYNVLNIIEFLFSIFLLLKLLFTKCRNGFYLITICFI